MLLVLKVNAYHKALFQKFLSVPEVCISFVATDCVQNLTGESKIRQVSATKKESSLTKC